MAPPPRDSPSGRVLPVKIQLRTVGLLSQYKPPPCGSDTGSSVPVPPVIVKPSRRLSRVSPLSHLTTLPPPCASMIVTSGPSELRIVFRFPNKRICSKYVPGATTISSPWNEAAMIAPWIVGKSPGT